MPALQSETRQRRKAARPLELLEAALDVFSHKGFAAARMDDVAERAGVSKGTLYLYYASKESLLKAVIQHHLATPIEEGSQKLAQHAGPMASALRETLVEWWVSLHDSPASAVFKLVVTEVRNFPELANFYVHAVIEPGQRLVGAAIQRGIDAGEFRRVDVPDAVRSMITPMVMQCLYKHSIGACTMTQAAGSSDAKRFAMHHLDLMLAGLATTRARRPIQTPRAPRPSPQRKRPA